MSTAIMRQSSMCDFDLTKLGVKITEASPMASLSPSDTAFSLRLALIRMNSAPTDGLANLLGNLSSHHHHQQQQQQQQPQPHRRLERTQSAPAPPTPSAAPAVNTSRYKTELCRPFEEFGVCKYGDKCQFAHGQGELRTLARHPKYKTELCRTYHTVGFCPYGPRCHFVHNQEEAALRGSPAPTVMSTIKQPQPRSRPAALSPALSLDSPSPPCSLSQSPTSSLTSGSSSSSFFSSEPELHSPGSVDEQRLPVFNRLSAPPAPLLSLGVAIGEATFAL